MCIPFDPGWGAKPFLVDSILGFLPLWPGEEFIGEVLALLQGLEPVHDSVEGVEEPVPFLIGPAARGPPFFGFRLQIMSQMPGDRAKENDPSDGQGHDQSSEEGECEDDKQFDIHRQSPYPFLPRLPEGPD